MLYEVKITLSVIFKILARWSWWKYDENSIISLNLWKQKSYFNNQRVNSQKLIFFANIFPGMVAVNWFAVCVFALLLPMRPVLKVTFQLTSAEIRLC